MKKSLSVILAVIIIICTLVTPLSVMAANVGTVKGVKVVSTTTTSVKIKWKKVKGATGYQVYYSTKKNSNYKIGKTIKKGKTVSATVKSLKSNKKYYFKVRAVKKKSKGKFSKPISAKTKKKTVKIAKTVDAVAAYLGFTDGEEQFYSMIGAKDGKAYNNGELEIYLFDEDSSAYKDIINCNGFVTAAAYKEGVILVFPNNKDQTIINKFNKIVFK